MSSTIVRDGFNVVDRVSLIEWIDYEVDEVGEYIHLIPDQEKNELRCYRSVSEAGEENKRIKTTIERVKFTFHFDGVVSRRNPDTGEETKSREVSGFYLTGQEAETFLTFVDLLDRGRNGSVGFDWWEESGMPMMEDEQTGIETINLRFMQYDEVERRLQISSAWQTPPQKLANIEGESWK